MSVRVESSLSLAPSSTGAGRLSLAGATLLWLGAMATVPADAQVGRALPPTTAGRSLAAAEPVPPAVPLATPVQPEPAAPQPGVAVPPPPAAAPVVQVPGNPATVAPTQTAKPTTTVKSVAAKPKAPPPPPIPPISQDPAASVHPESIAMIQQAAAAYGAIAAQGGWPSLPELPQPLKPGANHAVVPTLRQRLAIEGDFDGVQTGETYDAHLAAAVKQFQRRHGLPDTGLVGPATIRALNVPAGERQVALLASARRLEAMSIPFGPRQIIVNIPSATIEAIENGAVAHRFVAVVGDPAHPSPQVEARVGAINFHPTWTVPVSIIRNEIIPKMRKDPGYLAKQKIRIYGVSGQEVDPTLIDWSTNRAADFTLRQDSGTGNALGIVRIAMPNKHAVYMHDTPSKRLFGRDMRFLSHGCVRVADVLGLVSWILAPQGWTPEMVAAAAADGAERRDIRVDKSLPVAWTYLTGFVASDGMIHFRNDVYGLDKAEPADVVTTASIKRP